MHYRDRVTIVARILRISERGSNKTRIMYKTIMSYDQLKSYTEKLLESGLLSLGEDNLFYTTDMGTEFLKKYEEMKEAAGPLSTFLFGDLPNSDI